MRFRGIAIACLSLAAYSATPTLPRSRSSTSPASSSTSTPTPPRRGSKAGRVGRRTSGAGQDRTRPRDADGAAGGHLAQPGRARATGSGAEIALVGDAKVTQKDATRSGERLFVTALVSGRIRFTAESRVEDDRSDTELYEIGRRDAAGERAPRRGPRRRRAQPQAEPEPIAPRSPKPPPPRAVADRAGPRAAPPTRPRRDDRRATQPATTGVAPSRRRARHLPRGQHRDRSTPTTARSRSPSPTASRCSSASRRATRPFDTIELQADRAVRLHDDQGPQEGHRSSSPAPTTSARRSPPPTSRATSASSTRPADQRQIGEQRLEAKRVYYEFATDRAVLTDAVLHTVQPQLNIPVVMRAKIVRQLAAGEYRAERREAQHQPLRRPVLQHQRAADVRPPGGHRRPAAGQPHDVQRRATRRSGSSTCRSSTCPYASGSMTDRGSVAARASGFENSTAFGTGVETEWGLFETLGQVRGRRTSTSPTASTTTATAAPPAGSTPSTAAASSPTTLKQQFNFEGELHRVLRLRQRLRRLRPRTRRRVRTSATGDDRLPRPRALRAPALLPRRLAGPVPRRLRLRRDVPRAVVRPRLRRGPAARRDALPQAAARHRGVHVPRADPAEQLRHDQRPAAGAVRGRAPARDRLPPHRRQLRRTTG